MKYEMKSIPFTLQEQLSNFTNPISNTINLQYGDSTSHQFKTSQSLTLN